MRESDLRILESLLTAFDNEDEGLIEKILISNPQEDMTHFLESYLSDKLWKLEQIGADQTRIDECRSQLEGVRKNV